MDKPKSYLLKFEVLSETKSGSLVNGFSAAIGMTDASLNGIAGAAINGIGCTTNNCQGGNCVAGCGTISNGNIICVLK